MIAATSRGRPRGRWRLPNRAFACLVGIVTARPASQLPAQEPGVTLADAIALAERTQPRLAQASADVERAEARVRAARAEYLPYLSLSTSGSNFYADGPSRVDPITGQLLSGGIGNSSVNTVVSASLDLFTGFRRGATFAAARATASAAEAALTDARCQQRLATTNQFLDALAAEHLVRVAEAGVRRAEEQQALAVAKFLAGSSTRSDTLRSLVTLGAMRFQLAQAQARLAGAEAGLARLVGRAGRVRAIDDSALYRPLPSLDTAAIVSEVLARAPQVQAAQANRTAAAASLRAAKTGYWPTLTLVGSTGWNGSETNDYHLFNQHQISLQLNWNLFDRLNRETQIAAQRSAYTVAAATATDTERMLTAMLITQVAQLGAARKNVESTDASKAAAAEDLEVQQERYRVGLSTVVDLLTSQEALTQAEVNAVTARFDYVRARAQIEAVIGRTL